MLEQTASIPEVISTHLCLTAQPHTHLLISEMTDGGVALADRQHCHGAASLLRLTPFVRALHAMLYFQCKMSAGL